MQQAAVAQASQSHKPSGCKQRCLMQEGGCQAAEAGPAHLLRPQGRDHNVVPAGGRIDGGLVLVAEVPLLELPAERLVVCLHVLGEVGWKLQLRVLGP